MTCSSQFSLSDTGNKPRVIYIILPDERLSYYPLASLFINQQYVSLVENADSRGGVLINRVNFILDEFGNFTNIPRLFEYAHSSVVVEELDLIFSSRVLFN